MSRLHHLQYRLPWRRAWRDALSQQWTEQAAPAAALVSVVVVGSLLLPQFTSQTNLLSTSRVFAETGLVALGLAVVLIAGGIDLSVGAVFGLSNFALLTLVVVFEVPVLAAVGLAMLLGAFLGAINGYFVAYLRVNAFMTTIVTLIVFRAVLELLYLRYSDRLAMGYINDLAWDFLGLGAVAGLPTSLVLLLASALMVHLMLTRSRFGAHLAALGSSRAAARHAGIAVERVVFSTYVLSGTLAAFGGVLYATRLESASSRTGTNLEIAALAAVILGGVSLRGGIGSAARALLGVAIVVLVGNVLLLSGKDGNVFNAALALVLLAAVAANARWAKTRGRSHGRTMIDPAPVLTPDVQEQVVPGGPWTLNTRLSDVEAVGLDGAVEDLLVLPGRGVFVSDRNGLIWRLPEDLSTPAEIHARAPGPVGGLAADPDGSIVACVVGAGLYRVSPDGAVDKLADEAAQAWRRIRGDEAIGAAAWCDVAADGAIYFTDVSTRHGLADHVIEALEGRAHGRVLRHVPATTTGPAARVGPSGGLAAPQGLCLAHEGDSLLIAESGRFRILRLWLDGKRAGTAETVIEGLPGYAHSISRASDAGYWLTLSRLRTPCFDLAMRMPNFRQRMVSEIPPDEWIYPGSTQGCIAKVSAIGELTETLWDHPDGAFAAPRSAREFGGHLYFSGAGGGIGRMRLDNPAAPCACDQHPCAATSPGALSAERSSPTAAPRLARTEVTS